MLKIELARRLGKGGYPMLSFPTVDTLLLLAGIGGWVGAWHSVSLYYRDGPVNIDRACKMLVLPLYWGCASMAFYTCGICAINALLMVFHAMFQPFPLAMNVVIACAVFGAFNVFSIVKSAFKTTAEMAVAEVDAAEAEEAVEAVNAEEAGESDNEGEVADDEAETDEEDAVEEDVPVPEFPTIAGAIPVSSSHAPGGDWLM